MERLTKREGKHTVRIGNEWRRHDPVWDKLATYEDLEEQGKLIVLPCKIGDTVYELYEECKCKNGFEHLHNSGCNSPLSCFNCNAGIKEVVIVENTLSLLSQLKNFNKTVFLTREEAEVAANLKK